jgi:glycosyltransferase involved in cell wall biosynthesis
MPADPSIAIIIPVYNGAAYLADALRSVLAQQGCRITSVIVVDDGSTDSSTAIAAAHPPPVRLIQQIHSGAATARNRGLALATEDYIGYLDADDLLPPCSVAARAAALGTDPTLDAATGLVTQFISPDLDAAAAARLRVPGHPMQGLLVGAMLFRRRSFERVGGFDTDLAHGDFIDWYLRAQAAGLLTCQLDTVVLQRRVHDTNLTLRDKAGRKDYLTVVRRHLARQGKSAQAGTSTSIRQTAASAASQASPADDGNSVASAGASGAHSSTASP